VTETFPGKRAARCIQIKGIELMVSVRLEVDVVEVSMLDYGCINQADEAILTAGCY